MTFGHGGTISLSGIQPQQCKVITDEQLKQTVSRVLGHHGDQEIFVIFQFKSKNGAPLVDKGQVLARQQFQLSKYQFPALEAVKAQVEKEETNTYVKFSAAGTDLSIGKWTGMIDYLNVDGKHMLEFRESITPEFWRAPTDNDYGAGLQRRFNTWKNPQMKRTAFDVSDNSVVVKFDLPDQKAKLTLTYTLQENGEVIVREQMTTEKEAKVSELFRYGMQLQMPKGYDNVQYYGRGPAENYIDRNNSEFIGCYENKVAKEYFDYVRPQESGNHTDVRWFRVLNANDKGLEFYSNAPMEASALPYSTDQLDDGPSKDKKWGCHSGDLIATGKTYVHIQQRQLGLGCVNSWGAWPRNEYRLPYKDYDFTFAIRPIK